MDRLRQVGRRGTPSISGSSHFPDVPWIPGPFLSSGSLLFTYLQFLYASRRGTVLFLSIGKFSLALSLSFPSVIIALMHRVFLGLMQLNQFMFGAGTFTNLLRICLLKAKETAQKVKLLSLQAQRLEFKSQTPH